MSTKKKALQAAAGVSTGAVEPIGIDFDGTNDTLTRSSDLTGNSDGKTFTFSCWFYVDVSGSYKIYQSLTAPNDDRFTIYAVMGAGEFQIKGRNSSNNFVLDGNFIFTPSLNTWYHFICSIDLTNTSNRHVYLNDENRTSDVTWATYNNDNIDFTNSIHEIGGDTGGGSTMEGRLAGVYLDYTYRDLSVEDNRRDFIDADGRYVKPPTTGIVSVPMDDPDDPGRNDGTGGDFTLNGVIGQSGRGPNQYNAAASEFNTSDYLSRASLTGAADGKAFTFFAIVNAQDNDNHYVFTCSQSSATKLQFNVSTNGQFFEVRAWNGAGTEILRGRSSVIPVENKFYAWFISFDLANASNRKMVIDGVEDSSVTWSIYTNDNVDFTVNTYEINALQGGSLARNVRLSTAWLDDQYISDPDPFYDAETGKPKYLGANGELPTGSTPLVYLPFRADDAGSNKGTGGDFTVNSGPYAGARGPSEYWAKSGQFDGTSDWLTKFVSGGQALSGVSDTKEFTLVFAFKTNTRSNNETFLAFTDGGVGGYGVRVDYFSTTNLKIYAGDSTGTEKLLMYSTNDFDDNNWHIAMISVDLTNTSKRHIYVDGVNRFSFANTYVDSTIMHTADRVSVGASNNADFIDGNIGFLYFSTSYTDFSQESVRDLYVDQLGYPRDLAKQIESGLVPNPPLFLEFEGGPAATGNLAPLGANSGTGGDLNTYTGGGIGVNTPAPGGYVKG